MKKNILLVDDDYIFCYVNRIMLEKSKKTESIYVASNGKEALELLQKSIAGEMPIPDVIFLDINMPIMSGFDFLEAFNVMEIPDKERISVVMVSSSQAPEDMQRAKELGAQNYFAKPLRDADVRAVLDGER